MLTEPIRTVEMIGMTRPMIALGNFRECVESIDVLGQMINRPSMTVDS